MNLRASLICGAALAAVIGSHARALPVQATTAPQVNAGGSQPTIVQSGQTMTVDLNAPRTIIDWSSFNILNGESVYFGFDQTGGIALNRVSTGPVNIDGVLRGVVGTNFTPTANASGNIWIVSPQGVIFSPNARVDVGGLLASSATPSITEFLNPANATFNLTGTGSGGPVRILGGAQIKGFNQTLAFVAPEVTSGAGASVTGTSSVLYGAADSFRVRYLQQPNNGDLDILDFIVPTAAQGTAVANALNLQGSTHGESVFVIAISRAQVAGMLINAPGLLMGVNSTQTQGSVQISTGLNLVGGSLQSAAQFQTPGNQKGSVEVGQIVANKGVQITLANDTALGDFKATSISAGGQLTIAANDISVGTLDAGRLPDPNNPGLVNIFIDTAGLVSVSNVTVAGQINISPGTLTQARTTARPDVRLGDVTAGAGIQVIAGPISTGNLNAASTVALSAVGGPSATVTTGSVSGSAVLIQADTGAIVLRGNVVSTGVVPSANVFGIVSSGSLLVRNNSSITGLDLTATAALAVGAGAVGAPPSVGAINLGRLTASSVAVITSGTMTYASLTATGVVAGANALLTTVAPTPSGNISVSLGSDLRVSSLTATGLVRVGATGTATIDTVRANTIEIGSNGLTTILSSTSSGTTVFESGALNLGTITSGGDARVGWFTYAQIDGGVTAPNLVLQSFAGAISIGGANRTVGLSNADFQRIRVTGKVDVYAGILAAAFSPSRPLGDMSVLDLTVDPAKVPRLNLFAAKDFGVEFLGTVRTTAPGAILTVGESAASSVWTPEYVKISGAVGTARGDVVIGFTDVQGFKTVEFYTLKSIGFGSERFIRLIEDLPGEQIDIAADMPMGVAPTAEEINHLFLVAGSLKLSGSDRIIGQNTGTLGRESGIYLTGEGVGLTDPVLTIVGGKTVDLFGAIAGDRGLAFGQRVSLSSRISRVDGPDGPGTIRINGCGLGVGCAIPTPAAEFRVEQFSPPAPRVAIDAPVLSPPKAVDEDEAAVESVTAGTGNEEIWRKDK